MAKGRVPVPPLEWAAAAVGLLAALALLAVIAREAIAGRDEPVPVLVAEALRVVPTRAGHVVEVKVRNLSNRTAASVQVEGKWTSGGQEETSSATIDYVPGRSEATGGLIFPADPRAGRLDVRVTGYEIP